MVVRKCYKCGQKGHKAPECRGLANQVESQDDADGIEQLLIDVECCGVASATRKYIERHRVAVDEISHALEHFHVAPFVTIRIGGQFLKINLMPEGRCLGGWHIMRNLGWRQGDRLGKNGNGLTEPISIGKIWRGEGLRASDEKSGLWQPAADEVDDEDDSGRRVVRYVDPNIMRLTPTERVELLHKFFVPMTKSD